MCRAGSREVHYVAFGQHMLLFWQGQIGSLCGIVSPLSTGCGDGVGDGGCGDGSLPLWRATMDVTIASWVVWNCSIFWATLRRVAIIWSVRSPLGNGESDGERRTSGVSPIVDSRKSSNDCNSTDLGEVHHWNRLWYVVLSTLHSPPLRSLAVPGSH
jgi:hypothetical protein